MCRAFRRDGSVGEAPHNDHIQRSVFLYITDVVPASSFVILAEAGIYLVFVIGLWESGKAYRRRIMKKSGIKNNIRRLRFDHDERSQQELANLAGCTRQTIIALEQSKYLPSIELAFKIARAFGVPLEEVFQYLEEE